MEIRTVGIDLAKNVFQVHCMNERDHVALLSTWELSRPRLGPSGFQPHV